MQWPHKDLLCVSQLSRDEIKHVFEVAQGMRDVNRRPVKKVPTLKGRSVVLFFAEDSTRTRMSFDMAGKRLSADTFALSKAGSSLQKGESLKDTALTLQAMRPDAIVVRHQHSGAAAYLSGLLDCTVINAGDGRHAHPTQALLDGFTLTRLFGDLAGKTILILGDIAHSRVARSDIILLNKLGATVRLCGPRTLMPSGVQNWPVEVHSHLETACQGVQAIICLRLQLERMQAGLLPDLREYSRTYGLSRHHIDLAAPEVRIMHPGPINRGVEISSQVADSGASLILDQVENGVAVRMALLYLYLTRIEQEN